MIGGTLMSKIFRKSLLATAFVGSVLALDEDASSSFERTAHAGQLDLSQIPQVIYSNGPVVTAPRIVPVFFPGDPMAAPVADFLGKLAADRGYTSTLGEYGVGQPVVAPPIVLTEAAPAFTTNLLVGLWLAAKLSDPAFAHADANTVFVVVYPETTELDFDYGFGTFNLCFASAGVHDAVTAPSGARVPYTAVAHCEGFFGQSGADAVTVASSQLLSGALTNPRPEAPAYVGLDFNGSPSGASLFVSEVGDVCIAQPNGIGKPASIGYATTRLWSNRAARALKNPCRGAGAEDRYFNTLPLVAPNGGEVLPFQMAKAITIPEGGEVTIPVLLVGDEHAPRSWALSATEDFSWYGSFDPSNLLSFSWDNATGGIGSIRHLTVKRAALPAGAQAGELAFAIESTAPDGVVNSWVVLVNR